MNTEEKINTSNDADGDNNECVKLKKNIENEKYDINNLKDDDVYLSADSSNSYRYDNHSIKKSIKETINEISTNRDQSKKEEDNNEDIYNKKRNNYRSSSGSKEKSDKYCKKDKYDKNGKYDKNDKYDKHDKYNKHDKYGKHDKYDKHDKYGKHDKYNKHDKYDNHDKYNKHDKYDKHDKYNKHDKYDKRDKYDKQVDKIYILKKSSEHTRTSQDNSYYDSKRKYRNITSEDEEMKHHKDLDQNARKRNKSYKILSDKYFSDVENGKNGVEEKYKDKNKNTYQISNKNDNNINEKKYDKDKPYVSHHHNKDKYNKYDKYDRYEKQNHNIRYNEQDIKRKSTKYEKENIYSTHKGKNKNEKDEEQSEEEKEKKHVQKKETQNFNPSGLLAQEKIYKNGIEMKYTESIDAEKPDKKWRLYMFKDSNNNEPQKILHIHEKSYYLIGKEQLIVDIQLNNISISKQHAVIQFKKHESKILPFLLDLNSTNGTYINNEKIQPNKYYELRETDIIRFGSSNREFVLLHDTCQAD